jgi:mRNA-degrading endonuclease RelE of RelBE toxin-antitoxin system
MKYIVEITAAASEAIHAQARYIAVDCQAPLNGGRWLEQVWDAIDGLEFMPNRHNLASDSAFRPYEIRRILVGDYLILFTINETAKTVTVIGFRHGSRLPRPDNLK